MTNLRKHAATDPRKLHRFISSRKYPKQGTKEAVVIFTCYFYQTSRPVVLTLSSYLTAGSQITF